jgi:diphthine-ammonia ligase
MKGRLVFCSWSGGKDSAFALHTILRRGGLLGPLITMLTEGGERSRSHGLRRSVLEAQAFAMGAPILFRATTWADYEDAFIDAVKEAVAMGAADGVFGDIDFDDNRAWEERVCARAGARAHLPLWRIERPAYMTDLLKSHFRTRVIAIKDGAISLDALGEEIGADLINTFAASGIDIAGEAGEYHSVVTSCPMFSKPIVLVAGNRDLRHGVWFMDMHVADDSGHARQLVG